MMHVIGTVIDKYLQIISQIYYNGINTITNYGNSDESVFSSRVAMVTSEEVKNLIKSDKVVIFSKTFCPYCNLAKECFTKLNHPFTAIELDKKDDGEEYQKILEEITGARTVPRVFVNGECLGGGSDVKKMYDSGELAKKLA